MSVAQRGAQIGIEEWVGEENIESWEVNLMGEHTRFANDIQEQRVPSSRAQCILLSPDVDTFTPELRGPLCLQQSLAQSLGSTMLPPLSAR